MEDGLRFALLGEVRVTRDGALIGPHSPQQQALLGALLLRSGRGAAAHELIAAIWGEDAPNSALANLRTYAWRLRQALETDRSAPTTLVSLHDGYRLHVPPEHVDIHRAEQLAARVRTARAEERHQDCWNMLTQAIDLWQGEPLAGVPGPFAAQQRERLTELHLALLEERFGCDLQCGRENLLIPDLNAFTKEHPLRERPYGFLMRALYRTGRQADALAVFARARQVLAEELGVDPSPELHALQETILAGDPEAALRGPMETTLRAPVESTTLQEPATAPAPPGPHAAPKQLPADTADFTGRAGELERLCTVLAAEPRDVLPVLCITGMGGVGKTTLALRAAHRTKHLYPDGQLYADLRGGELEPVAPGALLATLLTALGVPGNTLPVSTDDRAALFRTLLDGRRVLLFLDNVRDLDQLTPLLPGSAGCAVIVTSRTQPTGLPTTVRVTLDTFDGDEASVLLARIIGPERVADEPEAVAALASACGHLPLAVRIVASRLAARPRWRVAAMTERLTDERRRIGELRAGSLAVSAAFSLSYQQLPPAQARVFCLLAPLARNGIGLVAAAAALGLDESETEEILDALTDAALLECPLPGRYRYHALVRSFALDLQCPDSVPQALAALLDHLLAGGRAAFQQMVPGDPADVILQPAMSPGIVFADLDAARRWVAEEAECIAHVVHSVAQEPAGDSRSLRAAADLLVALSPFGKDIPYDQLAVAAREAAATAVLRGDDRVAGRALFVCGNAALQGGRLAEAAEHAAASAAACRRADDQVILFQTLNDRGLTAQFQHRYEDAGAYYDQALVIARELGQRSGELTAVLNAALARVCGGRAPEALAACEGAVGELRKLGDVSGTAYALSLKGLALHHLGRYEEACGAYEECLAVCEASGTRGQEARARFRLADTLRALGRAQEARAQARRALAMCEERGARRDQGSALLVLAEVLAELGDTAGALARAEEARAVFEAMGLPDAAEASRLADRLAHGRMI
ncbi:BTAD domain-containing putative transcriptional regulator [Streptomyces sp. NPDC060031]|uniref:AfsR/SARP family transcriptional regulator n=1 Tax=Streptomyces sp. NPDC060031 TaxID=3347043 RepID=UPI0036C5A077